MEIAELWEEDTLRGLNQLLKDIKYWMNLFFFLFFSGVTVKLLSHLIVCIGFVVTVEFDVRTVDILF